MAGRKGVLARAARPAWSLDSRPSFPRIAVMCRFTVRSLIRNSCAIARLSQPVPRSRKMVLSLPESRDISDKAVAICGGGATSGRKK
jgi:hypothetical protein